MKTRNDSLTHREHRGKEVALWRLPVGETNGSLQHHRSHQPFLNTTTEHLRLYYKFAETRCLPQEDDHLYRSHSSRIANDLLYCDRNLLSSLNASSVNSDISPLRSSLASSDIESVLVDYYKNVVCLDLVHIYRDDENDTRRYILSWALHSRAVYVGMLMMSANFLRCSDSRFIPIAMEYRHRVLQILRTLLLSEGARSEVIMLACMLCSAEVCTKPNLLSIC